MDEGFGISPEMLVKAAAYAAWITAAGACSVHWLLLPRLARVSPQDAQALRSSAARVLWIASVIVACATFLRAWTHTAAAFGFAESFEWDNLRLVALESRWGQGWSWQAVAAVCTLILSVLAGSGASTWAWALVSLSVAAFGVAIPLVGHAAGAPARVLLHSTHLAGAGLWIGTLVVLFVDLIRNGRSTLALQLFAPIALAGNSIILLSGLFAATLYVTSPSALVGTAYGRVLLVKIALFGGAAAFGFVNWRRMQRVSDGTLVVPPGTMANTTGRELALAAVLVFATGVLTELPNP